MNKMTAAYFGVLVVVICLSTQVNSQNATVSAPMANETVGINYKRTTIATNTYSSAANSTYSTAANSTSPTGTGTSLQPATFFLLLPVIMATSFLHFCC